MSSWSREYPTREGFYWYVSDILSESRYPNKARLFYVAPIRKIDPDFDYDNELVAQPIFGGIASRPPVHYLWREKTHGYWMPIEAPNFISPEKSSA